QTLVNYGSLESRADDDGFPDYALDLSSSSDRGGGTIINRGKIVGDYYSIRIGDVASAGGSGPSPGFTIINSGTVDDVLFGSGDDHFIQESLGRTGEIDG